MRWAPPLLAGKFGSSGWASELKTVDLNGDGLRDVVATQNVFGSDQTVPVNIVMNKGDGRLVLATGSVFEGPPTATQLARKIVVADFNGDGRPDLFFADHGTSTELPDDPRHGHQNQLALSTPSGKLVNATANLPQHSDFSHAAAAADVDGNGTVDLFVGNFDCCGDKTPAEVLINDGTGHFRDAFDRLPDVPRHFENFAYTACEFVDVNRDGSRDLVLGAMEHLPRSVVLLNDGKGTFRYDADLPPKLFGPRAEVLDIAPVDLTGDGAADLLIGESQTDPYYIGTRIQVLINDGHGRFNDETTKRLPAQPNAQSWPDRILLEDFNGDNKPDFAIQYAPPGKVPRPDPTPFFLNSGDGSFSQVPGAAQGAAPYERGPVGFINGAGPHAMISVATGARTVASYYVSRQLVILAAPTQLTATSRLKSGVRLRWHPVDGGARYEVWRSSRTQRNRLRVATTNTTTFLDGGAAARQTYTYTVRAISPGQVGPFSVTTTGRRI